MSPKDPELHFLLGVVFDEAKMHEKVISSMKKVLELDPEHTNALNYIGYSYAERGIELDAAEAFVKKALALKPESGHILDSLGWVYYKKGEFAKAVKELERAMKLLPEDPIVNEHLGDAYLKNNNKKKALSAYENALKMNPGNRELTEKIDRLKDELKASK